MPMSDHHQATPSFLLAGRSLDATLGCHSDTNILKLRLVPVLASLGTMHVWNLSVAIIIIYKSVVSILARVRDQ